jgi:metallo-beta-lactamase class B
MQRTYMTDGHPTLHRWIACMNFGSMLRSITLPCLALCLCGATTDRSLRTTFSHLVPGVEVHTSYRMLGDLRFPSNGLIVQTPDSVVLIDTGWGLKATREVLRHMKGRPVAACITTHFHDDRTGGVPLLREKGIPCWGTARTRELALARGEAAPDARLPNDTTFTIDGVRFTVFFPGAGHAPDNIVVYLPDRQVLFGGCLVKSTEAGTLGNTADADLAGWPLAIERVQERFPDARYVIPGHQAWGGRELLDHTLQLLLAK